MRAGGGAEYAGGVPVGDGGQLGVAVRAWGRDCLAVGWDVMVRPRGGDGGLAVGADTEVRPWGGYRGPAIRAAV